MKNGSETIIIKRSEIALNPFNPKNHSDEEINLQKKNLKKVGFLGGIVWNKTTGRLLDGHRRIKALDLINKYDGTNDYEIKVECVEFDEKTEKQQLTYMAVGNSKADYNLIAPYIDEIDYKDVGLSDEDYQRIRELSAVEVPSMGMSDMGGMFISPVTEFEDIDQKTAEDIIKEHEEKPKMTKEQVKAEKQKCDNVAQNRQNTQDLYIFLSCEDFEQKEIFCELLGVKPTNSMMIPITRVLELIQ